MILGFTFRTRVPIKLATAKTSNNHALRCVSRPVHFSQPANNRSLRGAIIITKYKDKHDYYYRACKDIAHAEDKAFCEFMGLPADKQYDPSMCDMCALACRAAKRHLLFDRYLQHTELTTGWGFDGADFGDTADSPWNDLLDFRRFERIHGSTSSKVLLGHI